MWVNRSQWRPETSRRRRTPRAGSIRPVFIWGRRRWYANFAATGTGAKKSAKTALFEPEINTDGKTTYNSGFPPGVTVDKLSHYRRRRSPAFDDLEDHLRPGTGSFQNIISEYSRRFRFDDRRKDSRRSPCMPHGSLKVEGHLELNPEHHESFVEHIDALGTVDMEIVEDEEKTDAEEEDGAKTAPRRKKHYLFKRPTNLKLEGEFHSETETAEKFIQFLLTGRPDLARKSTTLRLEGEMETKTETRDKYVPYEFQTRPPLSKRTTNLHLEGSLDITTETRQKFVPFEVRRRTPLTKRGTNLHLEGDLELLPEYRDVYVEFKQIERPKLQVPANNLKPKGLLDVQAEKSEKFVDHQVHPVIPFLRGDGGRLFTLGNDPTVKKAEYREQFVEHSKVERSAQCKPRGSLKPEGEMEVITESKTQFVEKPVSKTETKKAPNNLALKGNIDLTPEYKNAYVNFYKDAYGKFGEKKDENEPETRRRRTISHPSILQAEGKLDANPEYRSAFVDFPRQRPSVRKPPSHLQNEGKLSHETEKRAHFVAHLKGSKPRPLKRPTELKLEGPFECQPEYRRAYIDYITREKVDMLRPPDNLGLSRRICDPPGTPEKAEEQKTTTGEGAAALPEAKGKPPLPVVAEQARKTSAAPQGKENLEKLEGRAFGPKVPVPTRRSQKAAPVEAKKEDRTRALRARRHYGSPVLVENLAFTPRTSPVQAILQAERSRWTKREDSTKQAFVVLSKSEEDCRPCGRSSQDRSRFSELYKEQKWMPSWYSSK